MPKVFAINKFGAPAIAKAFPKDEIASFYGLVPHQQSTEPLPGEFYQVFGAAALSL